MLKSAKHSVPVFKNVFNSHDWDGDRRRRQQRGEGGRRVDGEDLNERKFMNEIQPRRLREVDDDGHNDGGTVWYGVV